MLAAVDLGSNSFRLHVGRQDGDAIRIVKSERDPIRLGAGLDSNMCLTEEKMQAALASLARFRTILQAYPLEAVRVVATNTMRIAKNAATFLPLAEKAIGYPIEIISGEEEGRLIYMGVASVLGSSQERRLVIDIGGGSTEMILGQGVSIELVESFSIGTVGHSHTYFPDGYITEEAFDKAILAARSHFENDVPAYVARQWDGVYGSSGTIRAIADAIAKNALGDGKLTYQNMELLKARLIEFGHVSRISLLGMKPDRAAIIMGGLAVLMGALRELGVDSMMPIEAGLRMGVLSDLQLRATRRDRREQSVQDFRERFAINSERADRVAQIASTLYAQLKPASNAYERQLYWGGQLHELGMAVSHSGYHKHGAYMIENADLPGFTSGEQRLLSKLVLGQKGNLRKLNGVLADPDFSKAVLALRLAVMLMHSRIDVLADELRVRMKNKIELEIKSEWIRRHATLAYWIEKEQEWWSQVGVEFLMRD
ncbi:exopolyphosphatase/guanosine-5'-triphosphate,3'-diphosphate pyrophosphatase [Paucimonas lemoignei]|uniref:Exopolyphosphatase/guanosine-5'-triphosphate, 3'-diphosphate pyrophosphatase n=1 Tax=Paucimonas lemoignei TaxID=29443 RepID=A0A4R3I187_PAULE|nr:Ppx/GppA phosphatase family protein [Paucimonas lemoignei]TCS38461.1 exopolyphosphatase/guanosine-5'-triphosphate,3'-diphosphate pyrophosphatase [Paucimonas lemoignei]